MNTKRSIKKSPGQTKPAAGLKALDGPRVFRKTSVPRIAWSKEVSAARVKRPKAVSTTSERAPSPTIGTSASVSLMKAMEQFFAEAQAASALAIGLFNFIPGGVGRPVTDLATDLLYPELITDAAEVLRRLLPVDKEIATQDGRWLAARLMPYRSMDVRIDGVAMSITDTTIAKGLEARLRSELAGNETEKKT